MEALQAATRNPATFFGLTDSLGTVTAGKVADLVLLDGDPLADITNVMKLFGVVANGRYFDRTAIAMLDRLAARPNVRHLVDPSPPSPEPPQQGDGSP